MKVKFWGVRGSIPTPGPDTVRLGGNTSCVSIMAPDEPVVVLDAGTGIRGLGLNLLKQYPDKKEVHLLFSHTHWDHIQGLPFFVPLYIPGYSLDVYGPVHYEKSLEEILDRQMEYTYFPVRVAELQAKLGYHELQEQTFEIGGYKASSKYLNHPVLCLGYRFEKDGKSVVYCTDHEPYINYLGDDDSSGFGEDSEEMGLIIEEQNQRLVDFIKGADLFIMDSQYTPTEYKAHLGWGHSTTEHSLDLAIKAGVKRFALFHHDPDRTDDEEEKIVNDLLKKVDDSSTLKEIFPAREGLEIEL